MRQAGVLAAAGLVAIREMPALLGRDHERARQLAQRLSELPGLGVDLRSVQTNMVYVTVADAERVARALAREGVLVNALGAGLLRFVTHHQLGDADVDRAVTALTNVLQAEHG